MSLWQAVTWDISRAGGFTAYVLLALSVIVGLALSTQWQSPKSWPRIINSELHNFLSLISVIFTGIHILAVWVDPFTQFNWSEIVIPLASHYRPIWMALGIIGLYLGIAIGISTLIRPYIGYAWWRRIHVTTLVIFGMVTLHGIATGSDTRTLWGLGIYAFSVAMVGGLLMKRLLEPVNAKTKSHPVIATIVAVLTLAGVIFTFTGPLQPGWSSKSGTINTQSGNQSSVNNVVVQPTQQTQPLSNSSDPFTTSFSTTLQGTSTTSNGIVTMQLSGQLSSGSPIVATVTLQGSFSTTGGEDDNRTFRASTMQMTLGTDSNSTLYQSQVIQMNNQPIGTTNVLLLGLGNKTIQAQVTLRLGDDGLARGSIQGTPATR